MLHELGEFPSYEGDSGDIDKLIENIDKLNGLIVEYNKAHLKDKAELLMGIYQYYRFIDASRPEANFLHNPEYKSDYSTHFHGPFTEDLIQEFKSFGVTPFKEDIINAWDIQNTKSNESM